MMYRTYSIVQVQAFKMKKGDTELYEDLCDMVPCHSNWDDLVRNLPRVANPYTLTEDVDVKLTEDVTAMRFTSVGDWPGYGSFFDHEVDQLSLLEVVDPFREVIVKDLQFDRLPECSILTLWEGVSTVSYFGEWDFEYEYLGVMKDLKASLK